MEISEILQRVDELKAEIDALRPISPEQEQRIMQKFRLDWTFHSNAIEGNSLTYGETRALLLYGVTAQGKPLKDALDIKGHHEALDYLVAFVQQNQELTEAHIREIHKIILSEPYEMEARTPDGRSTKRRIAVGQYKTMSNHVITQTGETHYYATPEETPARMGDLMAWYRREQGKLHPLILAGTFHYEFVAIHPFDDGNGRMARLLMNLILMQAGYPPVVIRIDNRPEYYLALAQADAGELENFITLIGNLLLHSLELFLRGAKGDEIEELEDLDKKLALLDKKIEAKTTQPYKEQDTLMSLYQQFLTSFFLVLIPQIEKFDRFFSYKVRAITYSPQYSSGDFFEFEQIDEALGYLEGLINFPSSDTITNLSITYHWENFITDYNFNLDFYLGIEFRDYDFDLYFRDADNEHVFLVERKPYDSRFTQNQINQMVLKVINDIHQIVDQQVGR